MKHPLTSKERRGLLAVAAAALLCIGSGFIVRSCVGHDGGRPSQNGRNMMIQESDSLCISDSTLSEKGKNKSRKRKDAEKKTKKNRKKERMRKIPKTYPTRDPLSQPCD